MREIKFRAWLPKPKKMTYTFDLWTVPCDDLPNADIMQFTGLKDKNGKEIYEWDILEATDVHQGFKMVVEWSSLDHGWKVNYRNGIPVMDWLCMYPRVEVIGNIYENKELLTHE